MGCEVLKPWLGADKVLCAAATDAGVASNAVGHAGKTDGGLRISGAPH